MSGKMPLFAAAPRCVLRVGEQKIAYAVGLSMNVNVETERVKILGQYKTLAIEPLTMAPVTGTFRVVRLLSKATRDNNAELLQTNSDLRSAFVGDDADAKYQQAGEDVNVDFASAVEGDGSSVLAQNNLERHLDPETVLFSQTFDLDLFLKVPIIGADNFDAATGFLKAGVIPKLVETNFMSIKDCRITSASVDLTPGRLLEEPFSFEGLLAISHWDSEGKPVQEADDTWEESPKGGA